MEKYIKNPYEDLNNTQLDELLSDMEIPFTDQNQQNIIQKFSAKKAAPVRKKFKTKLLIPLVALFALVLVGFTQYDAVSQLFFDVFGNKDIGAYAQPLSGTSLENGIRMELLTGLVDGDNGYFFVSLTDESGSTNMNDIQLVAEQWELRHYFDVYGGNCRMVEYDEENNAAILLIYAVGINSGESVTFNLKEFASDEQEYSFDVPELNLTELLASHNAEFLEYNPSNGFSVTGRIIVEYILKKDELSNAVPGFDRAVLSNIGYQNGFLHVQMKSTYKTPNEALYLSLKNTQTGEIIQPYYTTNYDGTIGYREHVFKLTDVNELENYVLNFTGWYYKNNINGNWKISFIAPQQMECKEIAVNKAIPMQQGEVFIDRLILSPMSIKVDVALPQGESVEVMAKYADGSTQSITVLKEDIWLPWAKVENPETYERRAISFTHPINNYDDITAILLNGVEFPV